MSGICSRHQGYDDSCSLCRTAILPCPFCGGTNLNTSYENAIYCININCGAGVEQTTFVDQDGNDLTKEFVIECWNKRTGQ